MQNKYNVIIRYVAWAATLTVMIVIFFHSAQTAELSSAASGSVAEKVLSLFSSGFSELDESEKINIIENSQHIVRKSAHFLVYMTLCACCFTALSTYNIKKKTVFLSAVGISVFYAMTDEIHQLFVEGRAGRISDVLLDSVGAVTGALIGGLVFNLLFLKRKKGKTQ